MKVITILFFLNTLCLLTNTGFCRDDSQAISKIEHLQAQNGDLDHQQASMMGEMTQKLEVLMRETKEMEEEVKELTQKLVVGPGVKGQVLGRPFYWFDRYIATDNAVIAVAVMSMFASFMGFVVAYIQFYKRRQQLLKKQQ